MSSDRRSRRAKKQRSIKPTFEAPTECNGCGSCCHPVLLPYTQLEARSKWARNIDPVDLEWTLNDLAPMSRREVRKLEPWLLDMALTGRTEDEVLPFFYRCRHFDETTRQCNNYPNRPPACRNHPWRDGIPQPGTALPPTCSFNADIGQPVAMMPTRKG